MNKKFFALLTRQADRVSRVSGTAAVSFTLTENDGIKEITVLGNSQKSSEGVYEFVGNPTASGGYSVPVRVHAVNGFKGKDLGLAFKTNNPSLAVTVYANTRLTFSCAQATGGLMLGKKNIRFKPNTFYTFSLPMTVPDESLQEPYLRTQLGVLYTDGQVDEIVALSSSTAYDVDFITNPDKSVLGLVHIYVSSGSHTIRFKGMGIYERDMGSVANYHVYDGSTYTVALTAPLRSVQTKDGKTVCDRLDCLSGKLTRYVGCLSTEVMAASEISAVMAGSFTVFKVPLPSACITDMTLPSSDIFTAVRPEEIGSGAYCAAIDGTGSQLYFTLGTEHLTAESAAVRLSEMSGSVLYPLASAAVESVTAIAATKSEGYTYVDVLTVTDPHSLTVNYR